MRAAYVAWLLLVWGLLPGVVVGALTAIAFASATLAEDGSSVLGYALVGLAVFLLLYRVVFDRHGATARTLAGTLPCTNWFSSDRTPSSLQELNDAIVELRYYGGFEGPRICPSVVGSGWGYFTMRRGASGARIFMHRLTGHIENQTERTITFCAGSTVLQCARTLLRTRWLRVVHARDGRFYAATFWSQPTNAHISIGSWFACSNHGNTGPTGKPSSHAVADRGLQVWDMREDAPMAAAAFMSYEDARKRFDDPEYARTHLIVTVTFAASRLAPNIMVQKQLDVVRDVESAESWLKSDAYLRVLFMGSARTVGLGLSWRYEYKSDVTRGLFFWLPCWRVKHIDEHDCGLSRLTRVAQVDTCSAVGGCYEGCFRKDGGDVWKGISTLADANLWSPLAIPAIGPLAVAVVGLLNFEIICRLPGPGVTAETLWRLVDGLAKMHRKGRCWPFYRLGRTEVRYKENLRTDGVLFLDCAMLPSDLHRPFQVLRDVTGGALQQVALHSGKYTGKDVVDALKREGLQLVRACQVYYGDCESEVMRNLRQLV